MSITFDQEMQDKQKLYLGAFYGLADPGDTDLGRNSSCVLKEKERDRVYKDRKRGASKGVPQVALKGL